MNDSTTREINLRERERERERERDSWGGEREIDRGHMTDSYRLSSLLTKF